MYYTILYFQHKNIYYVGVKHGYLLFNLSIIKKDRKSKKLTT